MLTWIQKKWFKKVESPLQEGSIQQLKKELKEELKQELKQEFSEVKSTTEESHNVSPLSSKKSPKIHFLHSKRSKHSVCSHCQETLITESGEFETTNCRVSGTDHSGIRYLACRCGYVSRYDRGCLEGTGTDPKEMHYAAELFKKAGHNSFRMSLTKDEFC